MTVAVYALFLAAFALRVWYGVFEHNPGSSLFSDMKNYEVIADAILKGAWSPYHFFQPIGFSLIVAFLKKSFANWGIILGWIQAILSTISLWLIWDVVRKQWGEKLAVAVLFFGAFHIPWITLVGFNLSETFFTFMNSLLLWMTWTLYQGNSRPKLFSVIWGVVFMAGFWLKGTNVFLIPLTYLLWLWFKKQDGIFKFIIPSGIVVVAGLLLHGVFSYQVTGKFQLSGSAGGLNLVEGKCPFKWNMDANGIDWYSPIYYQRERVELTKWPEPFTNSKFFMAQGVKCMMKWPSTFVMSLESIPLLFVGNTQWPINQLPMNPWIRLWELVMSFFFIPGLVVGVIQLVRTKNEQKLVTWVLPLLSLILCVYIFKSEIRFRIPFDVWVIPVATFGWMRIIKQPKENDA